MGLVLLTSLLRSIMSLISVSRVSGVAAIAVVMTFLAGCGGGDGEAAPPSAPQTTPPPAAGTNAPPTIQGQPGTTILAGQTYSFQPTASDADGDALTFSATNLPAWASLNTGTGRVTGTPAAGDVATYAAIAITVSDGKASASLAAFSLTVTATGTGTAALSWTPPTENMDGTALTDLAGYRILYGRSAGSLDQAISLQNASLSTYIVENLTSGAWYFSIVAVNSSGTLSELSNLASKTVG